MVADTRHTFRRLESAQKVRAVLTAKGGRAQGQVGGHRAMLGEEGQETSRWTHQREKMRSRLRN